VFLNLVINAVQAIPEGNAGEHQIRLATSLAADGRVQIDVADDGVGIPPGLLGRIFEPFVTTKPVGVGTGLGLPICQRIVTGFAGQILVHSEPGRGTTFTVLLPPADSRSPEQAPPRRTVPHQM
jgi:signal transduction histidine kinase